VRLAIFSQGDPGAPPVLLVHGYPDNHHVWDAVASRLAPTNHVIRYDVRGAGASGKPRQRRAYTLDRLADDLFAVLDTIQWPVHLVGHDWGSIQAWEAVTDPRAKGRISRFTSISGPSLDHVGRRRARVKGQLRRSWYIFAFHLPVLPAAVWRFGLAQRWPEVLRRSEGIVVPAEASRTTDAIHGMKLYRANIVPRLLRPRIRRTTIPVQVITLTRDRYVSPELIQGLERWATDVRYDVVDAGHWSALYREADRIAELINDFGGR
jgi:pimeloyl-ACP methyl ester carboxylesterase